MCNVPYLHAGDAPCLFKASGSFSLSPKSVIDIVYGPDDERRKWSDAYESSKTLLECGNMCVQHTVWRARGAGQRRRDACVARLMVPPVVRAQNTHTHTLDTHSTQDAQRHTHRCIQTIHTQRDRQIRAHHKIDAHNAAVQNASFSLRFAARSPLGV